MIKREARAREGRIEQREREVPIAPLGNPINYSDMLLAQVRSAPTNMGWKSVLMTFIVALGCMGVTSLVYLSRPASDDFTAALVDSQMRSGSRFYQAGLYDDAIEEFSSVIVLRADYDLAYYRRGMAYEAKGDNQRAAIDYRKVLEISRNEPVREDVTARLQGLESASP